MKYNFIKLFYIAIFLFLLSLTNLYAQDKLIGTWERTDGEFAGTRINIYQTGSSFDGKLIVVTKPIVAECDETNSIKWMNMYEVKENQYNMIEITKNPKDCSDVYNYRNLDFKDSNTITVSPVSPNQNMTGGVQTWIKITSE